MPHEEIDSDEQDVIAERSIAARVLRSGRVDSRSEMFICRQSSSFFTLYRIVLSALAPSMLLAIFVFLGFALGFSKQTSNVSNVQNGVDYIHCAFESIRICVPLGILQSIASMLAVDASTLGVLVIVTLTIVLGIFLTAVYHAFTVILNDYLDLEKHVGRQWFVPVIPFLVSLFFFLFCAICLTISLTFVGVIYMSLLVNWIELLPISDLICLYSLVWLLYGVLIPVCNPKLIENIGDYVIIVSSSPQSSSSFTTATIVSTVDSPRDSPHFIEAVHRIRRLRERGSE